jgi:hypothetical protein
MKGASVPTDYEQVQRETLLAYKNVFESRDGQTVLDDLVKFAEQEKDAQVRAGRLDTVARILSRIRRQREQSGSRTISA